MLTVYFSAIIILSFLFITYNVAIKQPRLALAYEKTRNPDLFEEYKPSRFKEITLSALPVAVIVLILKVFFIDILSIPSESMLPNYHVNSLVLVNKTAYGVRSPLTGKELSQGRYPQKGSTVISRFPLNPDIMYIKRVLGLPGDIISLDEKGLKINNIPYPFEFIEQKAFGKDQVLHDVYQVTIDDNSFKVIVSLEKEFPVIKEEKVEQGTFFLLGDNLTGSSDSRTFGGVPWHYLVGKVL